MNSNSLAERAATLHDVLAELSDSHGTVRISLRQLAATLNWTYFGVQSALVHLEDVGLISWSRHRGGMREGSFITVQGR